MTHDRLAIADAVSDHDLLARLTAFASTERAASADLVAHLAALEARPAVYAAQGYGSLFAYCTQALRLTEDAASNRIAVAKAARRFPAVLGLIASGSLSLSSVRTLSPHLTADNLESVLERAAGRTLHEIEILIAELAPKPDVPESVRRARSSPAPTLPPSPALVFSQPEALSATPPATASAPAPQPEVRSVPLPAARGTIRPTAPGRYHVHFMMDEEMNSRLRRVQALLRREIPSGSSSAIFDRALRLLERDLEKQKLGAADRPRPTPPIRRKTDKAQPKAPARSRYMPRPVKRPVTARDGEQCAFVARDGRRCTERAFLEFHHVQNYAEGGPATVDNISLRCRRHNWYEAQRDFGPRGHTGRVDSTGVPVVTIESLIRTPPPDV